MDNKQIIDKEVRNVKMSFVGYTRSLALCSNMNYETENLDFIDRIKEGENYYDLGACEGRFSLYAALKGIPTISFEPEKLNFSAFIENIQINELAENKILKPYHLGVGEKNRKATMKIGQPWAGGHQKVVDYKETRADLSFDFTDEQNIDIISLDAFIEENKLSPPIYMKVDIDGSEMPFLIGAEQTLSRSSLKAILFELSNLDPKYDEIISFLTKCGLIATEHFQVPNEPNLFNILFERK